MIFRRIVANGSRAGNRFGYPYRKSELNGKHSLRCFGPVVWNELLPEELKDIGDIDKFKAELKKWTPFANVDYVKNTYVGYDL